MKLKDYDIIYFLGIGGIGMSALARWFAHMGKQVAGYDLHETDITGALQAEGIEIHFEDNSDNIPDYVIQKKERTLVVYTPALPKDHQELNFLQNNQYKIIKRAAALGMISHDHFTIAVAGTHGKTTTTTLIAHLLKAADLNFTAFLGGISQNYLTNLVINGEYESNTIIVAEADEYDRSFLQLHPNVAIITSADPDHLDIFGSQADLEQAFRDFINNIDSNGHLIIKAGLEQKLTDQEKHQALKIHTYSLDKADITCGAIATDRGTFSFDYITELGSISELGINVPGNHNVENALAAITAAKILEIPDQTIKKAISTFGGVKRRFEYILKTIRLVLIDDYAHHPVEIRALLQTVKTLFPSKKITAIFQPHLYSRTRDLAQEFAESLDLADEVLLLDIYPAREKPIQGVNSDLIGSQMKKAKKILVSRESIHQELKQGAYEVVVTIGAGDIAQLVETVKNTLTRKP